MEANLNELLTARRGIEKFFLKAETKTVFASEEEKNAGLADRYGIKEVPITEVDRESYQKKD